MAENVRAPQSTPPPAPLAIGLLGLAAVAYVLVPVVALFARVDWARLPVTLRDPATRDMLRLTLGAAVSSTLVAGALGLGLALWLHHLHHRAAKAVLRLLVYLPLALPPVVGGLALTAAFGRRGLLSPVLDALGAKLAFAFPGVVAAHVFVALPFVVVAIDQALRQLDPEVAASARGLGMRPWRVLRHITLPAIAPAIVTGAALAFARSLGEFGTTITFAGSMPGVTRTMPLGIYLARESSVEDAYALATLLIGLAVLSLLGAGLPSWWARRRVAHVPRTLGTLDVDRLRALTAPADGGCDIQVGETTVPRDQVTAVVGPNGSGKSTLLGVIAGRLHSDVLPVYRAGTDVSGARPHERGIVLLTQRPGLPPAATVERALTMVTGDTARTRALLSAAGLQSLADAPVPHLSGGQAAQVALLRALATRPQVFLLDEPLAAVDTQAASRWRQLLAVAASDRTTLLVTHNPLDVATLAGYIVALEDGAVRASGPATEMLAVPPTDYLAELAGLNVLRGAGSGSIVFTPADVRVSLRDSAGATPVPRLEAVAGTPGLAGTVDAVDAASGGGAFTRHGAGVMAIVRINTDFGPLRAALPADEVSAFAPGTAVYARVDTQSLRKFREN